MVGRLIMNVPFLSVRRRILRLGNVILTLRVVLNLPVAENNYILREQLRFIFNQYPELLGPGEYLVVERI